ncbi:hypothetical protein B9T31_02430 [Acinetobacter sp. ANC 4558]|uniref:hypothetical protein n=1 Tax=Acinetobacter sp. ANC 4558 TaxID=1977876 RepID=UPI000A32CB64|nr:hypothetical protein [Acinetobacter sp. ANC 4558]OTG88387.1 hypothetical protein B9T31_02430 [Acinetobacter sp. ANC 4558]
MTKTIDGFVLDIPPIKSQIIALAQYHHKKIDEAIFHQEVHLGQYGLEQKFKIDEFTKTLSDVDRENFYQIYSTELNRLAQDDDHHAHDDPETGNLGVIFIILVIIAVSIYFIFARPLLG